MLLQRFPIMGFYCLQDAGVLCLLGLWQLLGAQGSHRVALGHSPHLSGLWFNK